MGRVPAERHDHFDADGNLTGWTVVTREPEWLDEDRQQMAELAEVEAGSCPGCGWHESLVGDDSNVFGPVDEVCPNCAAKARWERVNADEVQRHVESHKQAPPGAERPGDGRWTYMRLLTPEQIEQRGGPGGNTH